MSSRIKLSASVILSIAMLGLFGCYEEIEPQQPQAQTPAGAQPGPINQHISQGSGSTLGKARSAAERTVQKAEEASRRVAKEADPEGEEPPTMPEDE